MALVEAVPAFELSVTLGATNDRKITKTFQLQSADAAAAVTDSATIMTALGNVSAGKIVSYGIKHIYEEDNYTRPTSEDAEYGEKAVIGGKITDHPLKPWTQTIPYPKIDIFVASAGKNRDVVDIADVAVIAYKNLFSPASEAFVSDGETAETLEEGRRL